MACTKTQNTGTRPLEQNHRNETTGTTETIEMKPPEPLKNKNSDNFEFSPPPPPPPRPWLVKHVHPSPHCTIYLDRPLEGTNFVCVRVTSLLLISTLLRYLNGRLMVRKFGMYF